MPDDPPVETPNRLTYHDGLAPHYGREDVGVLATIIAAVGLAFAAVPWGLMSFVRVPFGGGAGMACLILLSDGAAVLFLLLSAASERRGPPWLTGCPVALIVAFWIAAAAGAWR
jgi:hypothetical protein